MDDASRAHHDVAFSPISLAENVYFVEGRRLPVAEEAAADGLALSGNEVSGLPAEDVFSDVDPRPPEADSDARD